MFWRRDRANAASGDITAEGLQAALAEKSPPFVLDVRESFEWAHGHIPGAVHIPLGHLGGRIHNLPKEQTIVTVCRSGHRSAHAASLLRSHGFTVQNLRGGYLRWSGPLV